MLRITSTWELARDEIEFRFARSSGPGGQNVNKVNSKALLVWCPAESRTLPAALRDRVLACLAARLNARGELQIASQRFRDAGRNVRDCLERLGELLADAVKVRRVRRPSRPTAGSRRRRLDAKRVQSERKQSRQFRPE